MPVPISDVEIINSPSVQLRRPNGLSHDRVYGFSIDFCDKSTWYHDAIKVTDENLTLGDGILTDFALAHGDDAVTGERIVDLSHGKVSDENDILPEGETLYRDMGSGYSATGALSAYVPVIKLDGVEQTERPYGAASGGDYTINYTTGVVTFFTAPGSGVQPTATYWYVPTSGNARVRVVPPVGKRYMIERVEIQASSDVSFEDTIIMNVYAGAAPPNGVAVRRPTVVKGVRDLINWAHGSFEQIPAQGGATRGIANPVNLHRVEYLTEIPILSSQLMYLEVNLESGTEFTGEWSSVVIYGITEDE